MRHLVSALDGAGEHALGEVFLQEGIDDQDGDEGEHDHGHGDREW